MSAESIQVFTDRTRERCRKSQEKPLNSFRVVPKRFRFGLQWVESYTTKFHGRLGMPKTMADRTEPIPLNEVDEADSATHNATHNESDLHVLRRTYAAVRNLQVVECIG
jgi:hypothetical protein